MGSSQPLFDAQAQGEFITDDNFQKTGVPAKYKILVIDDDETVHQVSHLVLRDFSYEGQRVDVIDGYSGEDARRLLREHEDIAVVLLDVVMETDHAGLDVVDFIRNELKNSYVRIILRTGQPGQAPEHEVIFKYDINDYRDKSELTAQRLYTAITIALRSYTDIKRIEQLAVSNESLEKKVENRTRYIAKVNHQLEGEIRERIKANRALQISQSQLEEAQKVAKLGSWDWSPKKDSMTWSQNLHKVLGLPSGTEQTFEAFLASVSVSDRERVSSALKNTAGTSRELEYEVCNSTVPRKISHIAKIIVGDDGKLERVVSILQDITERRLAEESQRKLSSALQQIGDAVMITDVNGIIEYVNPSFIEATGYCEEDTLGQKPSLLKSGKHGSGFYNRLWSTISGGDTFSDVLINRHKDGHIYYEEKTITPLKNVNGEITHFVSSGKDITERMESQERLQYLAHHDPLTGLPNRMLMHDRLSQAIPRLQWRNREVAVIFIDIDRFKIINDTLGHQTGDRLLIAIAHRLQSLLREGDTVARLGGDEFAIILTDIAHRKDVDVLAQTILENIRKPFQIDGNELFSTASIGISLCPKHGSDPETLLKKADVAMYQAKSKGKNNFQYYTQVNEKELTRKLSLETKLRHALANDELHLAYQPQLKIDNDKISGHEALLRWKNEEFQNVPPLLFIPLLEETGMIVPVGEWVLKTACEGEVTRQKMGFNPCSIAVNVSVRQFIGNDLVSSLEQVIKHTGIQPELLHLEVTEGLLIEHSQETVISLERIHDMGVKLAIDDFGTGYSSMNYLKQFPFDILKIDKSFVDDIAHSECDAAIVCAIISMAQTMGMEIVAEGVETEQQLALLRDYKCDVLQGYLFSRPLSFKKLLDFERDNLRSIN